MSTSKPKHYAVVTSRRRQTYMCPVCGVLGGLEKVVEHTVRWQWSEATRETPPPSYFTRQMVR